MFNNFIAFSQQQSSLSGQRSEKPSFYRDFILDPRLNGPASLGPLPSLTRIGPDITFTRNSSASYIDQNGNIVTTNINIPRFEWGNHRTNLLSASNDINSSAWIGYGTKSPDWRQNAVGPDNVPNSAWSIPLSSAIYISPTFNRIGIVQVIPPLLSGIPLTVSAWIRADDTSALQISLGTSDGFNPDIKNLVTTNWRRFSYTTYYNPGAPNGPRGTQFVVVSGTSSNPNSKVYLYGLQCEIGSTATPYISTGTKPVTVSEPRGLLIEESRTNFVGQQNLYSWTQSFNGLSAGTGIAGLSSFIIGDEDNTKYSQVIYNFPTALLSATTYCFSCYIKKNLAFNNANPLLRVNFTPADVAPSNFAGIWFNQATGTVAQTYATTTSSVSVQDFGTYYRASFTFNTQSSAEPYQINLIPTHGTSGSATLTGTTIEVAGIQVEQGTTPTSYIPTVGAQYQRLADDATVTGSSFSSLFNNKEGSLFVEGTVRNPVSTPWLININNNASINHMGIFTRLPNTVGISFRNTGGTQQQFSSTQFNLHNDGVVRAGMGYSLNEANLYTNNIYVNSLNLTVLPLRTLSLNLGKIVNFGYINGHIRKAGYWSKRLSNTTLQALTLSSLGFAKYFAQDKSLHTGKGPGVEINRTTLGSYFDQDGILKLAGPNRPRFDHDPVTRESKGLLVEESRTNFIQQSNNGNSVSGFQLGTGSFIGKTENYSIAPNTSRTGLRLQWNSGNTGGSYGGVSVTGVTQTTPKIYTVSLWAKSNTENNQTIQLRTMGSYTPKIVTVTPLWQRFEVTSAEPTTLRTFQFWTPAGGSYTENVDISIWGYQSEEGGFATSYIPTNGATATRAEDVVQVNPNSFDTFYNEEQGTFYTKVLPLSGAQTAAVLDIGNTYNSIHGIWKSGEGGDGSVGTQWNTFSNAYFLSAGAQYTPLTSNFTSLANIANSASRIAYTYGPSFSATSVGSSLITQSTAISALPSLEGFSFFNGHIQTIEYYNIQLTTTQLTALSN